MSFLQYDWDMQMHKCHGHSTCPPPKSTSREMRVDKKTVARRWFWFQFLVDFFAPMEMIKHFSTNQFFNRGNGGKKTTNLGRFSSFLTDPTFSFHNRAFCPATKAMALGYLLCTLQTVVIFSRDDQHQPEST